MFPSLLSLALANATPIALYPLQARDVSAAEVGAAETSLRAEIGDFRRYALFGAGQTASVIAPPGGLGLNCDEGKTECLASLGRLLGAEVVVYGTASPAAAELVLVDVKTAQEVRRVRIEGPTEAAVREAGTALLAPDRYAGTLEVVGQHGRLAVDNADRADLPLDGPILLPVGKHQVTVTLPGRTSWNTVVEIKWRQAARIDGERAPLATEGAAPVVVYSPLTEPIPESAPAPRPKRSMSLGRQLSYAGFTGAVIGGALGIVFGAIAQDNSQSLTQQVRPIPVGLAPIVAQEAARTRDFGIAADAVWGVAAALGVASIVLYCVSPEHAPEKPFAVEATGGNAVVRF